MRKLFSWKLGRNVGRIMIFAMFLNLNLGCINFDFECSVSIDPGDFRQEMLRDQEIPGDEVITRAPRTGSSDMAAPNCCASSAELDLIRNCICTISTDVTDIESKIDVLDEEVREGFAGTFTALERIDTKLFQMNDEVLVIDSKIDELFIDFRETWTAIAECCDDNGGECNRCFRETWTILGDQYDVAVGGIDTLDEINSSTLSIIAWLKTIYAQSRGLIL